MTITSLNWAGILVGLSTFIIIGLFHPLVIKAEYYFSKNCWWAFLLAGLAFSYGALVTENHLISPILGVLAFSCFWSIVELFGQEKRVMKGWSPKNPKRTYKF